MENDAEMAEAKAKREIIKFITCIVRKFNDANDVWFLSKEFNVQCAFAATALRCCSMDSHALHQSRRETAPFHFTFYFFCVFICSRMWAPHSPREENEKDQKKKKKTKLTSSHGALATNKRRIRHCSVWQLWRHQTDPTHRQCACARVNHFLKHSAAQICFSTFLTVR